MKYRKLGNSGLIVSEVGLGTMQFGEVQQMGGLGQKETNEMVDFALDRGINYIDTADVYSKGESETLVGNAIKDKREEIVLSTKCRLPMDDNFNHSGDTRVNIMREVEASLRRLQTDYIDLYQMHSWDPYTPLEETLRTLDDLVRQGKVRYLGLSNYMAWQAAAALELQERRGLEKYITAQMYYSLVDRDLENAFISFADYYNVGIVVWSPLAGGFLTGKYDRGNPPPKDSRFAEAGQFIPFNIDRGFEIVEALKDAGDRHGASPARTALAWTLARDNISCVLIAARKLEHLEDNINAVNLELTEEDIEQLDEVSDSGIPYPRWMVLQQAEGEDPRARTLEPKRFEEGKMWENLASRNLPLEG
jgi:aryl-alcohol dehydrogenase-like predicted oxidoreductase